MNDKKDYCLVKKDAINQIYDSLIELDDKVVILERGIKKIANVMVKLSRNQNEIMPWLNMLEERINITEARLLGQIDKKEYSSLLHFDGDQNEEDLDDIDL